MRVPSGVAALTAGQRQQPVTVSTPLDSVVLRLPLEGLYPPAGRPVDGESAALTPRGKRP